MVETVAPSYSFLLIDKDAEAQWPLILRQILSPLGELSIASEEEAIQTVAQRHYDLVIIDAGAVRDWVLLISSLRTQRPGARVVVATASPTWQRAREALRAGAADYIRKSLEEKELRAMVQKVLRLPPPA